ncbi:hypothetical protein [Amycolatopsis sp. VC5-11]|uniref:hypothetical protein n=1 Tax=Amycolatopsis sp. VC5-11 TaxID=3120156 RepID=UPI00300B4C7E
MIRRNSNAAKAHAPRKARAAAADQQTPRDDAARTDLQPTLDLLGEAAYSPPVVLLYRPGSEDRAIVIERVPFRVHRPGYRLPETETSVAELASAAGLAAADLARRLVELESAHLLVWLPAYQLYVLNDAGFGEVEHAREFSSLLWKIGHVPQPDRPSDAWRATLIVGRAELEVCREDIGDELWVVDLAGRPTTVDADAAMAEHGFHRTQKWVGRTDTERGAIHTTTVAVPGIGRAAARGLYEPGKTVVTPPWDAAWHELAAVRGLTSVEPSSTPPPKGLW